MPTNTGGSAMFAVVNPDGTLIGTGAAAGNVVITNTPLPISGTVTAVVGSVTSTTTLNAVTTNATGVVADFGSAKTNVSIIAQGTGTLAGDLSFKISHNNTLFVEAASIPIVAAGVVAAVIPAGIRYARVDLANSTGAGTITATIMGA